LIDHGGPNVATDAHGGQHLTLKASRALTAAWPPVDLPYPGRKPTLLRRTEHRALAWPSTAPPSPEVRTAPHCADMVHAAMSVTATPRTAKSNGI
jgi:hypothetical protein